MTLQQIHLRFTALLGSKRIESAACAGDLHSSGTVDADMRAYVRAFAFPLVVIAVLALATALAPCLAPPV